MRRPSVLPSSFRLFIALVLVLGLLVTLAGCADEEPAAEDDSGEETVTEEPVEPERMILASTTSTEDSGLFEVLIPAFEEAYPEYVVEVVAVGTGAALELGRAGDADVLLVHAKPDEEQLVAEGYGTERRDVMYNDFIICGPPDDPAALADEASVADALTKLSTSGSSFVSRGDDSGTHKKELSLWGQAGITPEGDWYISAGQGMGDCLTLASEQKAYIMADRATYLALRDNLELDIVVEGDEALFNQYGVIPVTEAANLEGAQAFADWIVSPEGQDIIREYGVEEYGEPLFIPNAS